jgi:hypothetical protein
VAAAQFDCRAQFLLRDSMRSSSWPRPPRGNLRDRITVFRKVICATQEQVPRPRSTNIYHSFWFERPQARKAPDAREAAELLEQACGLTSGRYARL